MGTTQVSAEAGNNTCAVFSTVKNAPKGSLVRFVVGEDAQPKPMSKAEMTAELGDPFATLLLLKGIFPATAEELLKGIDNAGAAAQPLRAQTQRSFVLGEGSQIPLADATDSTNAGMRFLVTRGKSNPNVGPDLIISTAGPKETLVEVMAWDKQRDGFNYYRSVGGQGRWAFAGNSRHALAPPTKGKGPFEAHPSGNLIMKELKLPWVHWHSFKVNIFEDAFPAGDSRRTHPWFTNREGAEICETQVVIPSIRRWTKARLNQVIAADGTVTDPARIVEQVVTSPTVNLFTSTTESAAAASGVTIDLPPTFFVDADGLALVGLPGPPPLSVPGQRYASSLSTFRFKLADGEGFSQPGDTHFGFIVPERAFEDIEILDQAMQRGLISARLARALLMVDFPNPVFSKRRAALLKFAPATAKITNGNSTYSDDLAQKILDAAPSTPAGSPEKEFADRWPKAVNPGGPLAAELNAYYNKIKNRLKSQAGFNDYVKLAESHRNRVRKTPLFEFPLLFPTTNIAKTPRLMMKADATVAPAP